jgi:hypothetical protein
LDFFNLNSNNIHNDVSNPNIVQENELQIEKNIPNIFLPNSGIVPENGAGGYTTGSCRKYVLCLGTLVVCICLQVVAINCFVLIKLFNCEFCNRK